MNPRRLLVSRPDGPPIALRVFVLAATFSIVVSVLVTEPRPGISGDGLLMTLALAVFATGVALSWMRPGGPPQAGLTGAVMVGVASCVFAAVQPEGAGYAGIYFVAVVAGMQRPRPAAWLAIGVPLLALTSILATTDDHPGVTVPGLVFSVVPWFLVTRLMRQLNRRRERAEQLVEELRESRAAATQSAALAERGRLARDMHDVLAHSLSALALQLEGTRLLARGREGDPEIVSALEHAHRLAATGLDEARQAIAALRGDELPGPERLEDLADAFGPNCRVTVVGTPRELSSEARLALYRTAQEALTNVRKHSVAERVEIELSYLPDGATTLTVRDHGPGAPVLVGAASGYGLTGMRERAELLGGRLAAEPMDDGFQVRLWLPTTN